MEFNVILTLQLNEDHKILNTLPLLFTYFTIPVKTEHSKVTRYQYEHKRACGS